MQGNAAQARKRLDYLDIARGIGLILVVIGHAGPPGAVRAAVFSFHMPLFFIISGMLYRRKPRAALADVRHLIVPYVATVALVFAFRFLRLRRGMSMYYDSYGALLESALFGSGSQYGHIKLIGEIWFLLALFWARRYMDGAACFEKLWQRAAFVAVLMAFGIAAASQGKWFPLSMDVALVAVGFMGAGWLLANRTDLMEDGRKRWAMLFVCAAICWIGFKLSRFSMSERKYGELFITLPTALAGSFAVLCVSQWLARVKPVKAFLSFIGRHSMLFFCVHSLDWRMPVKVWGKSLIAPYSESAWYWALQAVRRFSFDLAITCAVVLLMAGVRKLWEKRKPAG